METFLARHASVVKGTLSGLDRVRFRGTQRWLANERGLRSWLWKQQVLLKDFKDYALGLTEQIKRATEQIAESAHRPVQYLPSSSQRKEDVAHQIAERDGITQGLVCVLTAVEPCQTFTVGGNKALQKLVLRAQNGKCLHHYFYWIDDELGWLNVRLQTWFPFTVNIVINGREWLSRQLRKAGIGFERRENCFTDIADVTAAQELMNAQLKTPWARTLDRLLDTIHPSRKTMFGGDQLDYYWSADETEWATDVMFQSPKELAAVYPQLVRHAITTFDCGEVLRFLGKQPWIQKVTQAEIVSHLGTREEGVRVKHAHDRNSVKMYDKQGSVLRVETTLNHTRAMKVFRQREHDPAEAPLSWQKLRKGVADLHRRCELSQKCNERYLAAMASVDSPLTLAQATEQVCERTTFHGRPARALNPLSESDARLLAALCHGEFAIHGFRNRDLCERLLGDDLSLTPLQKCTKITRLLRLLRAHGLIQKVPKTHRYQLTPTAPETLTALTQARQTSVKKLADLAA